MKMTDLFLAELEREAAATRRTLERVPDCRYDWKPHEKSMTLGRLAELVARLRLNDAPVQAIYGPSADDGSFD